MLDTGKIVNGIFVAIIGCLIYFLPAARETIAGFLIGWGLANIVKGLIQL